MPRPFQVVDVFAGEPYGGNPVAVVLEAHGIDEHAMQRFTRWTNLSEATFVLATTDASADYRVRIFTPFGELPFAGHPTLGTCHAWLAAGGRPASEDVIVQECPAGLVEIRRTGDGLAFAAPPLLRYEDVDEPDIVRLAAMLAIGREEILDAHWADNGPGWVVVQLADAEHVLAVRPGLVDMMVGLVGAHPLGSPAAIEVRAFFAAHGSTVEDPVTGSLNASVAHWLLQTGRATTPYVASQGTALGRCGRVHISRDDAGAIWVAGATVTVVSGEVDL